METVAMIIHIRRTGYLIDDMVDLDVRQYKTEY